MTDDEPTNDDIGELIDAYEDTEWRVDDWEYQTGRYDNPTLKLELAYDPTASVGAVRSVMERIEELQPGFEEGVPRNRIIEAVAVDDADVAIETAIRKGEIYEPKEDHYRRV